MKLVSMEISEDEGRLLTLLRVVKFGDVEIQVVNGQPTHVEVKGLKFRCDIPLEKQGLTVLSPPTTK